MNQDKRLILSDKQNKAPHDFDVCRTIEGQFESKKQSPGMSINGKGRILAANESAAAIREILFEEQPYSLVSFANILSDLIQQGIFSAFATMDGRICRFQCMETGLKDTWSVQFWDQTPWLDYVATLEKRVQSFRSMAEHSGELHFLLDTDGSITFVSACCEQYVQAKPEVFFGHSLTTFCHEDDVKVLISALQQVKSDPEISSKINIRLSSDAKQFQSFDARVSAVLYKSEVIGITIYCQRVEQPAYNTIEKVEANELKYRRIIDNMDLGYAEMDNNGLILFVNESFCRITGQHASSLINSCYGDSLFPATEESDNLGVGNRLKGQAAVYQVNISRKDGVKRTLLVSEAPILNNNNTITGSASIYWDITPMIEMEIRLHEKEVLRQKSILHAIIKTEEKQKQALGRELHDGLGQQLAFVAINEELMMENHCSAEEIVRKSKVLINAAINEIRQLARSLMPAALDNSRTLKDIIVESLIHFSNLKGVFFELAKYDPQIDSKLNIDQKHNVYRILQELTNNTVKYAEATRIILRISSTKQAFRIEYQDNGIGFDLGKVKKGVGMESIRTRIESLDGKLHFKTVPGKGVTCTFKIPYHPAGAGRPLST